MRRTFGSNGFRQTVGTYLFLFVALAIEFTVFEIMARQQGIRPFLSTASLLNVLDRAAVFGVVSVGMTFVILSGGIDLSVGSFIAIGGVIAAWFVKMGSPPVWAWIVAGWLLALAAGAAGGSLAGLAVTRFDIPPFIATLALMSSIRGLGYIIADGNTIAGLPHEYTLLGRGDVAGFIGIDVTVMLAVFLVGGIVLNTTRFGRHVRAIGGNEEAARLSGVPVKRIKWAVYAVSACTAIIGGLMLSSELNAGDPKAGLGAELEVIAAVVVGGTSLSGGRGGIVGTFLGLLIIATLRSGLNWVGTESFTQQVILGIVILAAVLLDQLKRRTGKQV